MLEILPQLIGVVVCLAFSSFSAAAETALVALGEARTNSLITDKGHSLLKLWRDHPERVIATLLVTNNLVNTLSASLVTTALEELNYPYVVAVSTGLVTLLILVFGDLTPKTLARVYAPVLAPIAMPLVFVLYYLLFPVHTVLGWIPRRIETALRGRNAEDTPQPTVTPEEIHYVIAQGVKQGVFDREKSELITSVLEFADIVAREVMVPRMKIIALPVEATKEETIQLVRETELSRIPVYDGSIDEIVGIFYVKTFLADIETGSVSAKFDLRRYVKTPFFVPELMKVSRLLREFQKRKVHLAIVVDEFGGTAGVVTLEDVVEEIVGDIQDEADVEEGRIRNKPDGGCFADASVTLRDLEPHLGLDFPDELDADSLGGFLTATVGKVPPTGSVLFWRGLRFTVRAADDRRVLKVEIDRVREGALPPVGAKGEHGVTLVPPPPPELPPNVVPIASARAEKAGDASADKPSDKSPAKPADHARPA